MSNPNQLFLLSDHIKLSLLERQRAISLNLEPTSQDGHISRSLESLREGLDGVQAEITRLEESGDETAASTLRETAQSIQSQYDDLTSQFHGHPASTPDSLSHPNDPTLSVDFARAGTRPKALGQSSLLKRDALKNATNSPKSVRFSDNPLVASEDDDAARNALFPYRDDPSGPPDQSHLDNQQIHEYHSQVIAEQDEQLDRLGDSISRQRELSIQIGDELDSHVQLLDGVDAMVDRHQSSLDKARKQLGTVARKAKDNMSMTIIVILIIVLILLIIILK